MTIDLSDDDFNTVSKLIYEKAGIVLKPEKKSMVYARLIKRLEEKNLDNFRTYLDMIEEDPTHPEWESFTNALTTNLTRFFREPHHFAHLKEELIKKKNNNVKKIRIWSAACSSGEEPYTIAMIVHSVFGLHPSVDVKILATDIDTCMLSLAKQGIYKDENTIPDAYKSNQIIEEKDGKIIIKDALKKFIFFRQLNLLHPWPMQGEFDFIFCRNVVIYFNKETQKNIFTRIVDLLTPDGWLYIGHSENLHNITNKLTLKGPTAYQKK